MVVIDPTLRNDLERLVEPTSRGDPESPLRWTCKSVRKLAAGLKGQGHQTSHRIATATTSVVESSTPGVAVVDMLRSSPPGQSPVSGHRFPRDVILLAVRYYLRLGAAAERIAGILADWGIDVSGPTILRWVRSSGQLCPRRSAGAESH